MAMMNRSVPDTDVAGNNMTAWNTKDYPEQYDGMKHKGVPRSIIVAMGKD